MGEIQSHRDLIVWQKAMDLTVLVYQISRQFPKMETYGLTSQLTRAASSVPANIAEGNARGTKKDYSHFLSMAKGSLMEAETFLLLAVRLDYVEETQTEVALSLLREVDRMLSTMRTRLKESKA